MRFLLVSAIAIAACSSGAATTNAAVNEAGIDPSATASSGTDQTGPAAPRTERVAIWLLSALRAGTSRDWAAAQAAFPDARWQRRTSDASQGATGSTDVLTGTISAQGVTYEILINGSRSRVHAISFNSPEDIVDDRAEIRQAFESRGGQWRSEGCIGVQMELVRLSHDGASLLVDFSTNMGSRVGPSSHYTLEFETPPETTYLEPCEAAG